MDGGAWKLFTIEILKTHTSAFRRQIHEATTIMLERGTVLNNKIEYNRCLVPTMEIQGRRPADKEQILRWETRKEARRLEADMRVEENRQTKTKRGLNLTHNAEVAHNTPTQEPKRPRLTLTNTPEPEPKPEEREPTHTETCLNQVTRKIKVTEIQEPNSKINQNQIKETRNQKKHNQISEKTNDTHTPEPAKKQSKPLFIRQLDSNTFWGDILISNIILLRTIRKIL